MLIIQVIRSRRSSSVSTPPEHVLDRRGHRACGVLDQLVKWQRNRALARAGDG
jgi:hypothetical protein